MSPEDLSALLSALRSQPKPPEHPLRAWKELMELSDGKVPVRTLWLWSAYRSWCLSVGAERGRWKSFVVALGLKVGAPGHRSIGRRGERNVARWLDEHPETTER